MRRRPVKIDLSLAHAKLRSQVFASYALMALLPILGLFYLVWSYVDPDVLSHQNTMLILLAILAISIFGFIFLRGVMKTLSDFRGHLKTVIEDSMPASASSPDGSAAKSPPESLEQIINGLIENNERLSGMFSNMEQQSISKTRELERVNRELQIEAKEHKEVEQALRKSNMQLSDALTELKELQQSMIRHERLSALGQLASGIAHDINNALMPVIGFTELIIEDSSIADNKATLLPMLQDILEGAREAASVVAKLRSFYRRDATLNFEEIVPRDLADEVEAITKPRWEQENQEAGRRVEFKTDASQAPLFEADRHLLRDALVNLVMNAADAMPLGGKVILSVSKDEDHALITVKDDGAGMNQQTRDRCFEPFFTTKGPDATGMGMAVTYGTVRRHSGSIAIDSEIGKGTTVSIRIPLQRRNEEGESAEACGIPPSIAPLKILVIDDDQKTRSTLETILKPCGHDVSLAETATAGIKRALAGDFDVVITDRAMPDMSGDEVARKIRQAKPGVPIIMATGFGDLMREQGERPYGIDTIISKPVNSGALKWALAEVTGNRETPARQ